ncbi:hypothetical protein [Glutamicibacter sp.]|uniref:hypothetical protein n=1 Tax=Glutamicibacter sp. TaxID=1931995 RepID=UPI0028BDAE4A|nr:hypothetical protein [Glutamicibacter sp.]
MNDFSFHFELRLLHTVPEKGISLAVSRPETNAERYFCSFVTIEADQGPTPKSLLDALTLSVNEFLVHLYSHPRMGFRH